MFNKKFDFIVGNVPWHDEIDKIFLLKCKKDILKDNGTIALITSASYLRGNSKTNKEFRKSFEDGSIERIFTYPGEVFINPVTNQPIKGVGACLFFTKGASPQQYTKLTRYFGDITLNTKIFLPENIIGTILYLGDEGKEIWNICIHEQKTIPLIPYGYSDKPRIHFNSKLDINYLGSSKPLSTITGSKLLTGVILDLDGSNSWEPKLKHRSQNNNAAKRYMLTFNKKYQAVNASHHFKMRLFGLLLAMTTTISHISKQSLGSLPFDILLDKEYNSLEEYENAYYKSKKLSKKLIRWVKTVGNDYNKTTNLKNNLIINKIERTQKRIKKTGEFFTPSRYNKDIIDDLIKKGLCDRKKNVLEPTCGDGNFILTILQTKLKNGLSVVESLQTTFGIDLMEDNIKLCHKRILELVGNTKENKKIICYNIVCADFLTGWDFNSWKRTEEIFKF